MIEALLKDIGIEIKKAEGRGQWLCVCPWCSKPKLYVNQSNGLWQCKKGCGKGNPYQLVQKLLGCEAKQAMQTLAKHGLVDDRKPKLSKKLIRKPSKEQVETFCKIKQISSESFLSLRPYLHGRRPWFLLPAFSSPEQQQEVGWVRLHAEGELIPVGGGEAAKAPLVPGSNHGLYAPLDFDPSRPIVYCEGWRDAVAARMLGYQATACTGGVYFSKDFCPVFSGKDVIVCLDADTAGQDASQTTARMLETVANSVTIVKLPYEVRETHGEDLHDYIVRDGHSAEDFEQLVAEGISPEKQYVAADDNLLNVRELFLEWFTDTHGYGLYWSEYAEEWIEARKGKYIRIKADGVYDNPYIQKLLLSFLKSAYYWHTTSQETYIAPLTRKIKNSMTYLKELAQAIARHPSCGLSGEPPVWLSSEASDAHQVIPANNCLILPDYTTMPHTERFYNLAYRGWDYDPSAKPEIWPRVLGEIFAAPKYSYEEETDRWYIDPDNLVPDTQQIEMLQEFIGYLMTGDTSYQKALMVVGPPRSGKGTISWVIQQLLGPQNVGSPSVGDFGYTFGLEHLIGKAALLMTDETTHHKDQNMSSMVTTLKKLTGEDSLTIHRKGRKAVEQDKSKARIVVFANEYLEFSDASGALQSRFLYLECSQSFVGREDIYLKDKLAEELPGIANWALEGLKRLRKRGRFEPTMKSLALQRMAQQLGSPVAEFGADCCEFGADHFITRKELYDAYVWWCKQVNRGSMGKSKFLAKFKAAFYNCQEARPREGDIRIRGMEGVSLNRRTKDALGIY